MVNFQIETLPQEYSEGLYLRTPYLYFELHDIRYELEKSVQIFCRVLSQTRNTSVFKMLAIN